ncbi:hypothetical protein B0H14DRAFT_3424566 [Mycena olivaceomarginata]|nr:hypothetical protein B0H14DRAFT_3424566 [Mycena olivaceomarginata]
METGGCRVLTELPPNLFHPILSDICGDFLVCMAVSPQELYRLQAPVLINWRTAEFITFKKLSNIWARAVAICLSPGHVILSYFASNRPILEISRISDLDALWRPLQDLDIHSFRRDPDDTQIPHVALDVPHPNFHCGKYIQISAMESVVRRGTYELVVVADTHNLPVKPLATFLIRVRNTVSRDPSTPPVQAFRSTTLAVYDLPSAGDVDPRPPAFKWIIHSPRYFHMFSPGAQFGFACPPNTNSVPQIHDFRDHPEAIQRVSVQRVDAPGVEGLRPLPRVRGLGTLLKIQPSRTGALMACYEAGVVVDYYM